MQDHAKSKKKEAKRGIEQPLEAKVEENRQTMAYKEMPYHIYFGATVSLYLLEIIGAIAIDDIGLIFEFISAISLSCLAFLFPGAFYLAAETKFGTSLQKLENTSTRRKAWAFVVLGVGSFIFFMTANILEMIVDTEEWEKENLET